MRVSSSSKPSPLNVSPTCARACFRGILAVLLLGLAPVSVSASPCTLNAVSLEDVSLNLFDPTRSERDCADRSELDTARVEVGLGSQRVLVAELWQERFEQAILHAELLAEDGSAVDWAQIEPAAATLGAGTALNFELVLAPAAGHRPGQVLPLILSIDLHDGQNRLAISTRLEVTVGEEAPLFRERFEIEPVIGQFSYRPSNPRTSRFRPDHGGD